MEIRVILTRSEVPGREPPGIYLDTILNFALREDVTLYRATVATESLGDASFTFQEPPPGTVPVPPPDPELPPVEPLFPFPQPGVGVHPGLAEEIARDEY